VDGGGKESRGGGRGCRGEKGEGARGRLADITAAERRGGRRRRGDEGNGLCLIIRLGRAGG
jgi:hypothetical protein